MAMATKLPSGQWRVRWRRGEARQSKTFPNRELAYKFEAQIKLDIASREFLGEEVVSPTFSEFAQDWIEGYCKVEKAKSQWLSDTSMLRHHLLPAFGTKCLLDLKRVDLIGLKQKLRMTKTKGYGDKFLSPKFINNILVLAKKMLATAVDWELLKESPFVGVKPVKKRKQPFAFWKPEEREAFLSACDSFDPDFHDIVLFACHTGLRLGEIAGLKWKSVDFDRKMITVRESYNFQLKQQISSTKNGEFADVPMNRLVIEVLDRRRKNSSDLVFVFDRNLLKSACKKLKYRCKKFGITPIRFHDLRHTFASCLAMAGEDLMVIKELMRHKSYQMTLRYAHLHPDHLAGRTDVLCAVVAQLGHEEKSKKSSGPRMGHEKFKLKLV
jgi:integrase